MRVYVCVVCVYGVCVCVGCVYVCVCVCMCVWSVYVYMCVCVCVTFMSRQKITLAILPLFMLPSSYKLKQKI